VDQLSFSVDMATLDRAETLRTAAAKLDSLGGPLGRGAPQERLGDLARALQEDTAEFGAAPLVYEITGTDFEQRDGRLPDGFRQLSRNHRFYVVELPVHLFPRYGWSFDRLEVAIEFNPDDRDRPECRPRALQVLPNRQLVELAHFDQDLSVSITSDLTFQAELPKVAVGPAGVSADATAKASGGMSIGIGPFHYRLKRAAIDTSPPGLEKVFWRFDGTKILQDESPRLIVIAQVPNGTEDVDIDAALQAYRNYNFLADKTRNTIEQLPRILSTFFKNGAPMRAEARYSAVTRHA
jgi:hypothetical protein